MSETVSARQALDEQIDAVEEAYEFMLAYAAQGRDSDVGATGSASNVRVFLERAVAALETLADALATEVDATGRPGADAFHAFVGILREDAHKAGVAIKLILAQPGISSQLVDNLNASIHLRAVLTDLFVVDEALKTKVPG